MSWPIDIYSDLSEKITYNRANLPIYARLNDLKSYHYSAVCHWHEDLEFIKIISGQMDFFINNACVTLHEGEGIFINSKRLHYGFSNDKIDCQFIALIINPSLFPNVVQHDCQDKFGQNSNDFLMLNESEILESITRIYDLMQEKQVNGLQVVGNSLLLCDRIAAKLKQVKNDFELDVGQLAIWKMLTYVQQNFSEKITIDAISKSGAVNRNRCCELFKQYVRQSPNTYLNHYRLLKSCEMLEKTKRTISEIAMLSGFQSPSYFTQYFHKTFGVTPKIYRQKNKQV